DLGVCPTPLVYFAIAHWELGGGVQVTGSHNAADYNGFKLCLGTQALHGEQIQDLRRRIEGDVARQGAGRITARAVIPPYQEYVAANVGRLRRSLPVVVDGGHGTGRPPARAPTPPSQGYVAANVGRLGRSIRVVVDAGNGTGGPVAPALYQRLGAQ